jgi:1-acyl-sn-glycerol-3-phosphate acyltransferase
MALNPILKVLFRLESKGTENIPRRGGVIFAAHHESYLDPVVVGTASPRQIIFLAREELFQFNSLFAMLISKLNAIPISREQLQISTFKKSLEILKEGKVLLLFPEGTRSPAGTIAEGEKGVGLIAAKTNVPVIPVMIKGSGEAMPRNKKGISPHKISVVFGKPLYFKQSEVTDKKDSYQKFSDRVMDEMRKLAVFDFK